MKCVLTMPEIEIQPRESSSTIIAYVVRSRPIPPYSSGMVTPKSPSSFICSTTPSGNLSSWSYSSAIGMTCSSTNCRTISVIARCSSVFSAYGVATAKSVSCCSLRVVDWRVSLRRYRLIHARGGQPLLPVEEEPDLDHDAVLESPDRGELGLDPALARPSVVVDQREHAIAELVHPIDVPAVLVEGAGEVVEQLERAVAALVNSLPGPLGRGVHDDAGGDGVIQRRGGTGAVEDVDRVADDLLVGHEPQYRPRGGCWLEADRVARHVALGGPGLAPARAAARADARDVGAAVAVARVEAQARDDHEGVARVRVDGGPAADSGLAPLHEEAGEERGAEQAAAVEHVGDRPGAVVRGVLELRVAAAVAVGLRGNGVGRVDHSHDLRRGVSR